MPDIGPTTAPAFLRTLAKKLEDTLDEHGDFIVIADNQDGTHTEVISVFESPYRMIGVLSNLQYKLNEVID